MSAEAPHAADTPSPGGTPFPGGTTIREYLPGDEHGILATFNRVFSAVDPNFKPHTLEQWRWRYLDNPGGWRIFVTVTPDGRVVTQCAAIGQRMLLDGAHGSFCQLVDSMSDPAFREWRTKPSAFATCSVKFWDHYGSNPDTVVWGLPVPAAWRVGKRDMRYAVVRTQTRLVGSARTWQSAAAPQVDVEEVHDIPTDIDHLFARAAAPYKAIAVRDAALLTWRFLRHPEHRYTLAVARRSGRAVGLCVHRTGELEGERVGLVCEWLVDPGDDGARAALGTWLLARTHADGAKRFVAFLPDSCVEWLPLQHLGMRVEASSYFIVGREAGRGHDMRWLYHNWYYTLGDTDLV